MTLAVGMQLRSGTSTTAASPIRFTSQVSRQTLHHSPALEFGSLVASCRPESSDWTASRDTQKTQRVARLRRFAGVHGVLSEPARTAADGGPDRTNGRPDVGAVLGHSRESPDAGVLSPDIRS